MHSGVVGLGCVMFACWQRGDAGNHWNGGAGFYGGQGYDYGYAVAPPQDQAMHAAAAYGAYPMYGNHQQQVS